ncbi:MAG: GTP-binding protein [Alphaproteobacteria bacterium]|nr:GTP-binding protein [Alphaproteobacteria bacterium]
MRLKTYTAPNMSDAMRLVRKELGDDAIIVSSRRLPDGATKITAALEEDMHFESEIHEVLTGERLNSALKKIKLLLESHSALPNLTEAIINIANTLSGEHPQYANDVSFLCSAALDRLFKFAPIPSESAIKAIMLIGPPGGGKTITTAKLVARATLNQVNTAVISTDHMRAGAIEQLTAFTKILNLDLQKALNPDELVSEINIARDKKGCDLIFIDTPGLNPFNPHDMDYLSSMISAANIEPALVMAAGGDASETSEIADIFAEVGAKRLIATRLDMTQKIGAILSAAYKSRLALSEVSITSSVANGLCPLCSETLAKLIVPADQVEQDITHRKQQGIAIIPNAQQHSTNNAIYEDEIDFTISKNQTGGAL